LLLLTISGNIETLKGFVLLFILKNLHFLKIFNFLKFLINWGDLNINKTFFFFFQVPFAFY